jgi:hypothetical protein
MRALRGIKVNPILDPLARLVAVSNACRRASSAVVHFK